MIRSHALTVFVTLLTWLLVALACDLSQSVRGYPTISQFVWDQPVVGIAVAAPVAGMLAAIAVHLWGPTDPPPDPPPW